MATTDKSRAWMITWNNYSQEDLEFWRKYLPEKCEQWAWQCEVGEQGTPHIQGALYFKAQRTFSAIKKDLPKVHLEAVKSWKASLAYCQKVSSRDPSVQGDTNLPEKPEKSEAPKVIVKDPMEGKTKKEWQIKIDDILSSPPDDRKVYWFVDKEGGQGKTTYSKHLALKYSPNFIYLSGKAADIKCGIAEMVAKGNNPDVCVFDYTRAQESFISYEAIEAVKNGIFYSGKYESGMVLFNIPHIIVFSNFSPDLYKLSKDRWVVENL